MFGSARKQKMAGLGSSVAAVGAPLLGALGAVNLLAVACICMATATIPLASVS